MRILQVAPSFARSDGGPSEILRLMVPELANHGHDVRIISTDKKCDEDDLLFARQHGIRVHPARRPFRWTFAPGMVPDLIRQIAWADVVHVHSVNTFTTTTAMILARVMRKLTLLQPHGALDEYHLNQGRAKKTAYNKVIDGFGSRGLNGVLVSSEREARDARSSLPGRRVTIIPLGVDPSLFAIERKGVEIGGFLRILFLGRVTEKKRLDLLLRAVALLGRDDVVLDVAGPFDQSLDYDPVKLAKEVGIDDDRIAFHGAVNAQRRTELLQSATIFALPSEDESFGVAAAEAMAAGCLALISENVGLIDYPGVREICIPVDLDPQSIAAAIRMILDDTSASAERAARGRDLAGTLFTWREMASSLHAVYEVTARSAS